MGGGNNLSSCLELLEDQGFTAEHQLFVKMISCILVGQRNLWIDTWRFTTGQHQNISAMNVITSVMMEAISKFTNVWNMAHWCSLVQIVTTRPNQQGVWGLTTKSTLPCSYVRTIQTNFQSWRLKVHLFMSNIKMCIVVYFNIYHLDDFMFWTNHRLAQKLTVVRIFKYWGFLRPHRVLKEAVGTRYLALCTQNSLVTNWWRWWGKWRCCFDEKLGQWCSY